PTGANSLQTAPTDRDRRGAGAVGRRLTRPGEGVPQLALIRFSASMRRESPTRLSCGPRGSRSFQPTINPCTARCRGSGEGRGALRQNPAAHHAGPAHSQWLTNMARMARILVVDDDVNTIGVLCATLARAGYTVERAASGQTALELLEQNAAV